MEWLLLSCEINVGDGSSIDIPSKLVLAPSSGSE